MSGAQRKELVKGIARGDEAGERLDRANTMAQSTSNAGDAILHKLHDQREKILSARCSAEAMEGDMDTSERKMSRMACEKCIQRWILWVIAFMFIGGLLFFLYWKLEIQPEKNRNCRRWDDQGKCVEDGGQYDGSGGGKGRAGVGLSRRMGRPEPYAYYADDDAYAKGHNYAAHRRILASAARAGAGEAEESFVGDQDAQTFRRDTSRVRAAALQ